MFGARLLEVLRTTQRDPLSLTVLVCVALVWIAFFIVLGAFWWSDTSPVAMDGTAFQVLEPVLVLLGPTVVAFLWALARAVWIRRVLREGMRAQANVSTTYSEGVVPFTLRYRWGGRSFQRRGWAFPFPFAAFLTQVVRTEVAFLEGQPERPVVTRFFDKILETQDSEVTGRS